MTSELSRVEVRTRLAVFGVWDDRLFGSPPSNKVRHVREWVERCLDHPGDMANALALVHVRWTGDHFEETHDGE